MSVTKQYDADKDVWVIHAGPDRDAERFSSLLHQLVDDIAGGDRSATGDTTGVELWIHDVDSRAHECAVGAGFTPYRDLWQLRCLLPVEPSNLVTRSFTTADVDAMIRVNNRAFSWHPEQSGLTRAKLDQAMAEPWFNADGFRLYERDGVLTGFCWTKLHTELDPVVGEIYVIAIDPSAHGEGLGTPMTLAGLDWIYAQGITHAMLYVESDNDAANATYRKIGFTHHLTDRAYSLTAPTGKTAP